MAKLGGPRASEAAFQATVMDLALLHGWRFAHWHDSRRQVRPGVFVGDKHAAGFPDLVLVRDRVIAAELKRDRAHPAAEQRSWLDALAVAGMETYLWRLDDLDEISYVLQHRWTFKQLAGVGILSRTIAGTTLNVAPNTMWIGGGRRDERKAA